MRMTTILLADDHAILRQGLRALLESEPDFQVVGEAVDGLEAIQLTESLYPDVVVLDLMMPPGLSGLDVTQQVSQRSPTTHVVILSMYANPAYILEALHKGASAYVLKKSTADELVQAVRAVMAGQRYLSPPLSEVAIDLYLRKADASRSDLYDLLTMRQREVLRLIVDGYTSTEIAAQLVLSPRTVEKHRAEVMRKLGTRTQAELIRYALQRGLYPPEEEH
jgi:two-component system, NarL family, response regulator NreC